MEGKMETPPPYSYHGPPNAQQQPQQPVMVAPRPVQTTPVAVATITMYPPVGPKPSPMTCPSCGTQIVSRVEYQNTMQTHLCAFLLCIFGCWCCCCIPYCTGSCRNAGHYCPNCNAYIGEYVSTNYTYRGVF